MLRVLRILRVLWAHLEDAKGAMSPCGAWWQPPERFGVAKGANEPFWCSIKKKPEICVSDIEKTHKYIYVTPL